MISILFPGQGAQQKGMGKALFPRFRELTVAASDILGYSIEKLCLEDPGGQLRLTQFTQPALYVVNALGYLARLEDGQPPPNFVAGHSLGEYNALLAAGVFDFETGLRIVQRRADLMGQVHGGGMAAVVGLSGAEVARFLSDKGLHEIDLANFNSPTQTVISGPRAAIDRAVTLCQASDIRCVALNVSGAFHSRYMVAAQASFNAFLKQFKFHAPQIQVIANASARPYAADAAADMLTAQLSSPVRWTDTVRYLLDNGCQQFVEIGASILTKMVNDIRASAAATLPSPQTTAIPAQLIVPQMAAVSAPATDVAAVPANSSRPPLRISAASLGNARFRRRFGLKYAYLSGAMYRGVASPQLVARMGKSGFLGFLGTAGLPLAEVENQLKILRDELRGGEPFGVNLLPDYAAPGAEMAAVELFLKQGARFIEAAAFMHMTPAIVYFRLQGLSRTADGALNATTRVLAKVSRPEVAEAFMSPAPTAIVEQLLAEGKISREQAQLAKQVPVSEDICIEADSGGHTDGGIPTVLFPAMLQLKNSLEKKFAYQEPICLGLAGGIGTPEAAAAAFIMGADFILTGSINQCTVEAGTSDDVKQMLQDINVQDTEYAPAGDMFEMGAKVQVLKRGVFFPMRANKLHALYSNYGSLDEIPEMVQQQLQTTFFKRSFAEIWDDTKVYFDRRGMRHEIAKAEANPKHKMALVFRWYFAHTSRLALAGQQSERVNYQVHTGPALGAFNQWVKGTPLESWTKRHADHIAIKLLEATADNLNTSFARLAGGAGG